MFAIIVHLRARRLVHVFSCSCRLCFGHLKWVAGGVGVVVKTSGGLFLLNSKHTRDVSCFALFSLAGVPLSSSTVTHHRPSGAPQRLFVIFARVGATAFISVRTPPPALSFVCFICLVFACLCVREGLRGPCLSSPVS